MKAPFVKGKESLCVNDWWQRPANEINDLKVPRDQVVCFGLIRFHKKSGEVTLECWPSFVVVTRLDAKQFPGWPITVKP